MAELDDGEFWLPPQFLTEDDILMDFRAEGSSRKSSDGGAGACFPSFGHISGLSSPVESVVSSVETESDEEDYMAGLTRKIAHSTLEDDFWKGDENQKKSWPIAGSPQSTLCGVAGGWGCKQGSSRGSSTCPSPPSAAASRKDAAWDLLYAAAGEVARMRMIEERAGSVASPGLLGPPRKRSPVSVPPNNPNPNLGFYSNQSVSYQQLQVAQFQQLRQQQMMKQQGSTVWGEPKAGVQYQQNQIHQMVQNRARSTGHPLDLLPSAWPTLQQSQQQQHRPSSGMRAVFLANPGTKRECAGTGVFLPRRVGSPTEPPRKKPGCSTVLIPDRVVQALNLNLEAMKDHPQSRSEYEYDAALRQRNRGFTVYPKGGFQSPPAMNQEVRLPAEWTY